MERATYPSALVDTDILIDASRGLPEAGRFLDAQADGSGITISIVSAMELVTGCRNAEQLSDVKAFLGRVEVLPLTRHISTRALQLMERYTLSHHLLLPDALIAATALGARRAVLSRNTRHFGMIAGLDVIRPY